MVNQQFSLQRKHVLGLVVCLVLLATLVSSILFATSAFAAPAANRSATGETDTEVLGILKSIPGNTLVLEGVKAQKGSMFTVYLTNKTSIIDKGKGEPVSLYDLKVGQLLSVRGQRNKDGSITASTVLMIPDAKDGKPKGGIKPKA